MAINKEKEEPKVSLAEGLEMFATRGGLIKPARLTKKRAIYILRMLKYFEENFEMEFKVEDDDLYNEYQLAIQWVFNIINKKYSIMELHSPPNNNH